MPGRGGGTQGPSRIPVKPTPPNSNPDTRRVTRGMNGVSKRKRQEIEISDTESTESALGECPGSSGATANPLGELTALVAGLKEIILQQGHTIARIQTDLAEVKSQNGELKDELKSVQAKLEAYSVSPPTTRSWASVAASPSGSSFESRVRSGVSLGQGSGGFRSGSEKTRKEPTFLRISTQPRPDDIDNPDDHYEAFQRYLPSENASAYIRNALSNADSTKDVQVVGVGTTKTGYVIRFKDERSTDTARKNGEWLEILGNGTKLVKPRYGVVVHRVPTADFSLPQNEKEGIRKIMEENDLADRGFDVNEIAWLKRPDKPLGVSGSMGIWLSTSDAAEWIVNNGLIFGERYIGSVEHYQIKRKRCHRCQRFGHLAWSCKERPRCGHCAGEHARQSCPPGVRARCVDCNGEHPTGDRNCQKLADSLLLQ